MGVESRRDSVHDLRRGTPGGPWLRETLQVERQSRLDRAPIGGPEQVPLVNNRCSGVEQVASTSD